MKTASLAAALFLGWAAALATLAMAQEAEAPGLDQPAEDTIEPGVEQGGEPAEGDAESTNVEGASEPESVIEGTVEPQAEPAQDDPSQAEPAQGEPAEQAEPAQGEAPQEEPAQEEPAEQEPAQAEPAQAAFEMPDLPVIGIPVPNGINMQPASTELARDIRFLDGMLNTIMALIVLLVMALILVAVVRFSRRANPNPSSFTHNTTLEIGWTLVPVLILIVIGSFSLPILFKQLEVPESDLTIKAVGNQWFWTYEYPDYEMSFDSLMLRPEDLAEYGYTDEHYLLATDTAVVVPVNAVVRLQTTAADVIHAFAMPAFGVKMDAIPGRLNEMWFSAEAEGIYFGQCSELCGKDHSYMPITVKVLSQEDYEDWLDWAIGEYGGVRPETVASAD